MRRFAFALLVALFALAGSVRLLAGRDAPKQYDPKLFQELRWRLIGPSRGGRVLAVTGVRGQPEIFYFGSVGGGVWKTNDAGRTWKPVFDSQSIASIGAIAVAPSDSKVIYVGSGEADMRSSISYGNGMYKSADGGKTWAHIGLEDSRQIGRILVDPRDANKVFVAALGHAYGPNQERGVFRSRDGGKSWQKILFHDENTGAIDVAFEPGNPKTIYASLWQTRRPPWSVYPPSNGPGSGLYRSIDGGDHWERVSGQGLPTEGLGRIGIAFAPSNPRRIYLIVDAKEGGLFRSDNSGQSWLRVSHDRRIWQRGWYFGEASVDPKDPDTVYVPNTTAYQSHDGGKTFAAFKGAPGGDDYHELWIDPDEPRRMILSCDQGAIVTRNGGETWSSWFNQPTGQFYHVVTDNQFPYWVYGAQQDSNAIATPSRSRYRSLNFHDWRPIDAGDESGYIAPDPLNPGVVFGGFVARQDFSDEQVQQMPPTFGQPGKYRRTWTLPLVFSPIDRHVLYFGSQVLFRTADGGNSWQVISPDLTREDAGVPPNLDATTAADTPRGKRRGVIYTIGPSYVQAGEIWAGTDDGQIQLTQDEGKTWENVTPPELTPWSKVTHIEASHSDAGTAYAAVDRHRLDDYQAYLYRTRDFGKSWQRISDGIPEGSFLNCVREDPARKGLLYACTEKGAYVSLNDGDDWESLQLNLPVTSVRDLVVHESDLVIATFGRSFWILDNVTPLRQMDAHVAAADAWLFRPEAAIRMRTGSDQGTPVPMDEFLAANPPEGAVLDYYLKERASAPIQLEIFDSEGNLVRRFASDDVLHKTNPNDVPIQMEWVRDPKPLLAEAGMHRFVWDLRYAMPKGVRRSFWGPAGPLAAPGNYTVKLTTKGKSSTQPLTIRLDPRVKTPQDALTRQFGLASKLAARLGEVSMGVQQIGDLRKQIDARKKDASGNSELLTALQELEKKVEEAVEPDSDADFGLFGQALPNKEHETLPQVEGALTRLLVIVDSSELGPTTDAATASARWEEAAQETLAHWAAFQKEDLASVNALLEKVKLKPLFLAPMNP
ncbi:MAG: hypothetical protein AUI12_17095 [Acidobacteria bacterium 13_2_20CM_2_57_6]|nr:MAG: hypothetical protein AUI12_17095 [Acidobacteria bacterium 13_2_20CM_2_57_6]